MEARLIGYIKTEGKSSKLGLLHGAAHSQLALVSQLTVATILGCVAEVAPDDRKTECATRLGALDVTRSSAHKAKEFVSFHTLFNRLFVLSKVA